MADDPGPLNERDLDELKENLRKLDQAEEIIRRAQNAGMDFGNQATQARELRAQLTKVKNSFFPGR